MTYYWSSMTDRLDTAPSYSDNLDIALRQSHRHVLGLVPTRSHCECQWTSSKSKMLVFTQGKKQFAKERSRWC